MITNRSTLAETQLLTLAGYDARTQKYADKLEGFLQNRDDED